MRVGLCASAYVVCVGSKALRHALHAGFPPFFRSFFERYQTLLELFHLTSYIENQHTTTDVTREITLDL